MVWNVSERKLARSTVIDRPPSSAAFTPDGQRDLGGHCAAGLQSSPVTLTGGDWTPVKGAPSGILRIAFVNGTTLAVLRPEGPELYEWPTMTLLPLTPSGPATATSMAPFFDGKTSLFVGLAQSEAACLRDRERHGLEAVRSGHGKAGKSGGAADDGRQSLCVGVWHIRR